MTELASVRFQRLFEVRVLHHYWLDDGPTVFDDRPVADQEAALLRYDVRRAVTASPTPATTALLDDLGGTLKATPVGFVAVLADRHAAVPSGATFEVSLTAADPGLFVYTAGTLRPRSIVSVGAGPDRPVRRFKEAVPVLSNRTGTSRTLGGTDVRFLSTDYPTGAAGPESLFRRNADLVQVTGDETGQEHVLGRVADLPVYVHDGDAPAIDTADIAAGAPARGVELGTDLPDDVIAVVRVVIDPPDPAFAVVGGDGRPLVPAPVFDIRFRNRWTTWRYRNRLTGAAIVTDDAPRPLTWAGNAGPRQKPPVDHIGTEPGVAAGSIARLTSEIFV